MMQLRYLFRALGSVLLFACALLLASPAMAQVSFDAASSAATTVSAANPIPVSWNHTISLSKKPYLVVSVGIDRNGGAQTVTTATFGTEAGGPQQAMTLLGSVNNGTINRVELWGLAGPTPGTHQITLQIANGGLQNTVVVAGGKSFTNVFQTAATGAAVTATGTSLTPAVAVTNSAFDYVADAVMYNNNVALTAGANQTNALNQVNAAPAASGGGSTKTGFANTTMSWTATGAAQAWSIAAVPLQSATPQILFDAASNFAGVSSNANPIIATWNHTTTTAANRYLVVAVQIRLNGGTYGTNVTTTGVSYGAQAMTLLGGATRATNVRAELWGLVAPASGTNAITVTIANTGARTLTVTAGAQSFSNIDQIAPTGTLVAANNSSTTPTVAVTNSAYDYVVDSVGMQTNVVLTPGLQQDQRYNTAIATAPTFTGASSSARGYTNVTMAWSEPGGNQNWCIAAIPLKQVSVGIKKVADADVIKLGQPVTYTLTVTNYSAATVNNVILTDAIPAGSTFVSQTGCAGTGPVTCNIGSLAAAATSAPITITVVPNGAGTISNVATVSWNGNAGTNQSETVKTITEQKVCATPGKDGAGGTLAGIKNDYWPGSASVAAGATSITVGARNGAGAGNSINAGDLLIVMQMQDAAFDTSNDETYGEGTGSTRATGIGSGAATTLNNAGRWEYVIAGGTIGAGGGALAITGGGTGGGLLYAYTNQTFATTTTQGQRTFQVIRVPQYTTATLGSTLTAAPWNGATGGVLAIDVSGTISLGGATVSVNGLGFRGGGGIKLTGDTTTPNLASTDFRTIAPTSSDPTLITAGSAGDTNGSKGEGITGTPRYIYKDGATIPAPASTTIALDTNAEGYVGGSMGRGAPGNAGGGSTDGVPTGNGDNSGGGGGGNGGFGGAGGNGWNCNCPSGGQGGGGISPSLTRITMGGGGGAGTSNNGSAADATGTVIADSGGPNIPGSTGYYSSGANGGGVVIMRALQATGTATVTANGFNAYNVGRDGGGGGGAGGSVLITTQQGTLSGLTIQAKGGNGGNAWIQTAPAGDPGERHGPGGGGGGGYVLTSSAPASTDVSGGVNGVTDTVLDDYGAQPGTSGVVQLIAGNNVLPGGDGATCAVADLAVTDSAPGTPVDRLGNVTFTQTVVNNGPAPADSVVFYQQIPASATFQSMSVPAGWTCITPAVGGTGSITCTRPTLLQTDGVQNFSVVVQANSGTPSGFVLSNTVNVSSATADSNPANNIASATNPVVFNSQSDMSVTLSNNASAATSAGSNVVFTSVAKNVGQGAATGAVWSMPIPANMSFQGLAAPPPGWTCITPAVNATSGTISCTAGGTIAAGVSGTFQPTFKVLAGTAAGTVISGTATTGATNDPDTFNNTASSSFTVRGAAGYDMVDTMTVSANPAAPGQNLTYTAVVTNNGPASAPAAGAGVQWTMAIPAGENFQSIGTVPAGWSCATPAVGATAGSVTCTFQTAGVNQPYPAGTTSTFTPVFQVNSATASGTTLTGTSTVNINGTTAADNVPANNSSSVTTLVTQSTNADVAIVKTAGPTTIGQGQLVNYILAVTNNGPATATNVTISDTLPANVSFVSDSIGGVSGACAGTSTINCSIATLGVNDTINISVIAQVDATGTISNTASKTGADQTDPVAANNSSTANLTVLSVTMIKLRSFDATQQKDKAVVTWYTDFEQDNLGVNLYRDEAGKRTKLNKNLIAGSAFTGGGGKKSTQPNSIRTYRFRDKIDNANDLVQYWLEDVDIKGVHTMHGPVTPIFGVVGDGNTDTLAGLGANGSSFASPAGYGADRAVSLGAPTDKQTKQQYSLANDPGLKVYVTTEGWQRVSRAAMTAAGYDPGTDGKSISVYTQGTLVPVVVNDGGDGKLDPNDTIEFYGVPVDTVSTGARTYWIRAGKGGSDKVTVQKNGSPSTTSPSVPFTFDRKDRTVFFAALTNNGEGENFFGPIISSEPVSQDLTVANKDASYGGFATLTLLIQGASSGMTHSINVVFAGVSLGSVSVNSQDVRSFTLNVPHSALVNGPNTLTLTALNGDEDVSLLVDAKLTYQHLARADNNAFEATLGGSRAYTVGGFTANNVRVLDVTDVLNPIDLGATIAQGDGGYTATFTTPAGASRVVLAFADSRVLVPTDLSLNKATKWNEEHKGADFAIITTKSFATAAAALQTARQAQGINTVIVDADDLYDEFNFGQRSPQAIRDFIAGGATWKTPLRYVLFIGDASIDPRNYLGLGAFDFIPTKLVPMTEMKTASDDWFVDLDGDSQPDLAIGRLPVRTADEANTVVNKIINRSVPASGWGNSALLISDGKTDFDFATTTDLLAKLLPAGTAVQRLDLTTTPSVHGAIVSAMNGGDFLVDFVGHGSVELWGNAFSSSDAAALTNGNKLPFVVSMECLNGYFHDLYTESLAEALLKNANGGAAAVWASSTLTEPDQQAAMNRELYRLLFNGTPTLGDATVRAKRIITDIDVKKSWMLFGDPTMKLR